MSVKDGMTAEQVAAQERDKAAKAERERWAAYYRTYNRCVEIAEDVWTPRLDAAQATQQGIAETMRDRGGAERLTSLHPDGTREVMTFDGSIPVPLFTPRDRQQFVKEVAATLLISADRRSLTVQFPKEMTGCPPAVSGEAEAASGVDEGPGLDLEVAHLSAQTK